MSHLVANLIVLGLLVAAVWLLLRRNYVFLVAVEATGLRVVRGKAPGPFLFEADEVCREHDDGS